jgi:type VI secretion system protein ImpE
MNYTELLRAGRLAEARAELTREVKGAPADLDARTLLFQVLAFQGEWGKAERHLELLTLQAPERSAQFLLYRNLVAAERARAEVARGARIPEFLTEAPPFFQEFLAGREGLVSEEADDFANFLANLEGAQPALRGVADGTPFEGFSDCDARHFWLLEVFIHDRYLWFPFSALRELSIGQPATLLDLLWAPASIVTWDGLTAECYLPVLYPGSAHHENEQVRLGRMTDWLELGGGQQRAAGQHLLQVGTEEKGILELRQVTFAA